jgi:hypothetical protein
VRLGRGGVGRVVTAARASHLGCTSFACRLCRHAARLAVPLLARKACCPDSSSCPGARAAGMQQQPGHTQSPCSLPLADARRTGCGIGPGSVLSVLTRSL